MANPGHVSLWHPWNDRSGIVHTLALWQDDHIVIPSYNVTLKPESVDDLISMVGRKRLYVVCSDIMDANDIPDYEQILRHKKTEAYMSRTGKVVALRMKDKYSGFFIPAKTWGMDVASKETLEYMQAIFSIFKYEAITPASLSEKVLRSTLPEKIIISRPSDSLRRMLLSNPYGARIDEKEELAHFAQLMQVDMNKTYLHFSRKTIDPFVTPHGIYYGDKGRQDDRWKEYPVAFLQVTMTVHGTGIHPIQLKDELTGNMRKPVEGETFTRGMFSFEIQDCIEKGYTLEHIEHGYGFPGVSNWMEQWCNKLMALFEKHKKQPFAYLFKTMMVGLPGRFLKSPENYLLVHENQGVQDDDIPIDRDIISGTGISTPWYIRPEYNLQSAQLTPIGCEVVARARQALYKMQVEIQRLGGEVQGTYVDSINYTGNVVPPNIGKKDGQWKRKTIKDAWIVGNQIIPRNMKDARMPGITGEERDKLWQRIIGA